MINLDRLMRSKAFDTKIKSSNVQNSERILGHLLGPAFVMSMFYISGQSYLNTFYTDVLNLTPIWGRHVSGPPAGSLNNS
jgi:hypothetical protein